MIHEIAPWLLGGLPLAGALLTLALWSKPRQVKNLAVVVAAISFVATVALSVLGVLASQGMLLACLLPLAACASILGQPVEPEHRIAWAMTLVFLGLGLTTLTSDGLFAPLSLFALFVLVIALLYRHHSALWPISWWGIATFALGAAAMLLSGLARPPLSGAAALIACAILLPLVPFHDGYFTALTRLPGNLPSFVVVLLPALGLHGLTTVLPTVSGVVATTILLFSVIGTLYGALKALAQTRVRLLLAYGSLSFFSILWCFAAGAPILPPAASVFVGAVSLGTSGLLIAWQAIRTRYGDDIDPSAISGLVATMPRYAVLISVIALAVMGLPPFGVYAGFIGLALASPLGSTLASFAVLLAWLTSSWYVLDAVQSLLFGKQRTDLRSADVVPFETAALAIIVAAVLVLGLVPAAWFTSVHASSTTAPMEWFAWMR